jgi:hypothetical protein
LRLRVVGWLEMPATKELDRGLQVQWREHLGVGTVCEDWSLQDRVAALDAHIRCGGWYAGFRPADYMEQGVQRHAPPRSGTFSAMN